MNTHISKAASDCRRPALGFWQAACLGWFSGILLCGTPYILAAEVVLPQGAAPPAIVIGHFPDRVHEFVWRNWTLVKPEKLAKILDCTVDQVHELATSMGLPTAAAVSPDMLTRGYVTLIRRNWHLLPYDQLLELVEMSPEQLAFSLRE